MNFVFVLIDDLGWADLSCYGSTFDETPHLDALAASGMRLTNAYAACPVCSPTRASIMTGRHPVRVDITDWIPGQNAKRDRFHRQGDCAILDNLRYFVKQSASLDLRLSNRHKDAAYGDSR